MTGMAPLLRRLIPLVIAFSLIFWSGWRLYSPPISSFEEELPPPSAEVITPSPIVQATTCKDTTVTVTATPVDHKVIKPTVISESPAAASPIVAAPVRKIFASDFERYHGYEEDYQKILNADEQKIIKGLKFESTRQKRIKNLYDLDGAQAWSKFIDSQDESGMPPFTKFAQKYIYDWQNPPVEECKKKKFMVLHAKWDRNGLGTVVHGTGWILGLAMRRGYILLYNDTGVTTAPGNNFVEPGCQPGLDGKARTLDCIFEPFSSCSTKHLTKDNHVAIPNYWDVPDSVDMNSTSIIPPIFGQALRNSFPDMHTDAIKYWWRAQSAAYMMRVNRLSMARIKELRLNKTMHTGWTHTGSGKTAKLKQVDVPFPMPDGSFSMHVRHGDKGVEMELIPLSDYVDRASLYAAENPLTARKTAFISTEDVAVFEEAKEISSGWISTNTTSNEMWTWVTSDIPRINGGPEEQLNQFGNRTDMTLKWMQQLLFSIEASVALGTRGSGWNRMIDELRCIWIDCRTPYLEVGPFEDWVHYNF